MLPLLHTSERISGLLSLPGIAYTTPFSPRCHYNTPSNTPTLRTRPHPSANRSEALIRRVVCRTPPPPRPSPSPGAMPESCRQTSDSQCGLPRFLK